jgi:hypothetical protein
LEKAMLRQIMIQAEPCEDAESMFRLSIDATLIAKGVTVGQACYLVSEILGRMGAQDAETMSLTRMKMQKWVTKPRASLTLWKFKPRRCSR